MNALCKMRLGWSPVICVLLLGTMAQPARAEIGDIVGMLPRCRHGYWGGVAWFDGNIYESCKNHDENLVDIYVRRPGSDEVLSVLQSPVARPTYVSGITYDSTRNCFWLVVAGDGIYQLPITGGDPISGPIKPFHHMSGIFYDESIDRLWVTENVDRNIVFVFNPDTLDDEERIYLDFSPSGIVRVGDHFWIARRGDDEERTEPVVFQCTLAGERTGVSFALPMDSGANFWDIGGVTFDGRYLWVKGGRDSALYQVDIDYPACTEPCSDGDECTVNDSCVDDECVGEPMVCETSPGECHSSLGWCSGGECVYDFLEAGTVCDDQYSCSSTSTCNGHGDCVPRDDSLCDVDSGDDEGSDTDDEVPEPESGPDAEVWDDGAAEHDSVSPDPTTQAPGLQPLGLQGGCICSIPGTRSDRGAATLFLMLFTQARLGP